jgi:hypothetical protein
MTAARHGIESSRRYSLRGKSVTDDTNFRVQVRLKDGTWKTLFEADFPMAMGEVQKLRRRGLTARFSGNGSRPWKQRSAKRREYRAIR